MNTNKMISLNACANITLGHVDLIENIVDKSKTYLDIVKEVLDKKIFNEVSDLNNADLRGVDLLVEELDDLTERFDVVVDSRDALVGKLDKVNFGEAYNQIIDVRKSIDQSTVQALIVKLDEITTILNNHVQLDNLIDVANGFNRVQVDTFARQHVGNAEVEEATNRIKNALEELNVSFAELTELESTLEAYRIIHGKLTKHYKDVLTNEGN